MAIKHNKCLSGDVTHILAAILEVHSVYRKLIAFQRNSWTFLDVCLFTRGKKVWH